MRTIVYSVLAASLLSMMGCGRESAPEPSPEEPEESQAGLAVFDKVDLLFVVDNSMSMLEEQQVLASSVEKLLRGMINPPCVSSAGDIILEPETPEAACPTGSFRRSAPVRDLHIGVISSNIGDLGSGTCSLSSPPDQAHLRTLGESGPVATYQDLGFLAWDPDGELTPAGESDFQALVASAVDIVAGVGETGCGYEMPLEAMNRFLVDPAPYASLVQVDASGEPAGIDDALLAERAAFLRPDSIVGVVLLSDENDCSLDPTYGGLVLKAEPFFRATSVCETDPDDACCVSCGMETPAGCTPDPICADPKLPADNSNLRCFDQKRRYGVDFHYPTARYVNALSAEEIDPSSLDYAPGEGSVQNPLLAGDRQAEHVIFTTITGVPWQDLVVNPNDPTSALKTPLQMESDGSWAWLVGTGGGAPLDPFMIESVEKRLGVSPATSQSTLSPSAPNGGDRSIPAADDLQYACIFALAEPIPAGEGVCSCYEADGCDDPACVDGVMVAAAARPGTRQLEVARALGAQSVVGSICPPVVVLPDTRESEEAISPSSNYDAALSQLNERVGELLPELEQ